MPDGPSGIGGPGGPGGMSGGFGGGGGSGGTGGGWDEGFGFVNDESSFRGSDQSVGDAATALAAITEGGGLQGVAKTVVGILVGVFTGSIGLANAATAFMQQGFEANEVNNLLSSAENAESMGDIQVMASQAIDNSGGPKQLKQNAIKYKYQQEKIKSGAPIQAGNSESLGPRGSPTGDFWSQFAYEWQGLKDDLIKDQEFKQKKLAPVFDTYQKRLSGLSDEPTFKPISVGMGDFKTSFMPRRSMTAADKILGSELAETDVMLPSTAHIKYIDRLEPIGMFKKELKSKKSLSKQYQQDDQGTWLDAIGDIMKIGSSAADIYTKVTG